MAPPNLLSLPLRRLPSRPALRWTGREGGGPDIVDEKMPSSDGRDRYVRDTTAQRFSASVSVSTFAPVKVCAPKSGPAFNQPIVLPLSPPVTPESSPAGGSPIKSALKGTSPKVVARAPLTPRSSTDSLPFAEQVGTRHRAVGDATFLDRVFPAEAFPGVPHSVGALPTACLQAAVVDADNGLRTLYVAGLEGVDSASLRDVVVEVLDLADERVEADEVVWVVGKKGNGVRELLQGLLYVGGSVVKGAGEKAGFVLVGIDI